MRGLLRCTSPVACSSADDQITPGSALVAYQLSFADPLPNECSLHTVLPTLPVAAVAVFTAITAVAAAVAEKIG